MRTFIIALALLLGGCAAYSPSLHNTAGKHVVYKLTLDQAKTLVSTTMASHFAGREVQPVAPPAVGYTTYTRMLLDTWATTATITPVVAKAGTESFDAVAIDVRGSGTSFVTGRVIYENFKDRMQAALDATAAAREVDSYTVR